MSASIGAVMVLADPTNRPCAEAGERLARDLATVASRVDTAVESFADDVESVVVLGGDGFLMEALSSLEYPPTPIFGVNFGSVGFLMNARNTLESVPELLAGGRCRVDEHAVLEARVETDESAGARLLAFNDFVVERMSRQSIRLTVSVDGEPFNNYAGDGFVLASPAGSTAYNLAARGPVVHPGIEAILLTPLYPHRAAPFTSVQFPLVVPIAAKIEIRSDDPDKRPMRVVADGLSSIRAQSVTVADSGRRIRLLRSPQHNFIRTLTRKIIGEGDGS